MKKSKHFRKDVIIARIVFAVLCILIGVLIWMGISALVGSGEEKEPPETETQMESLYIPPVEETEEETETEGIVEEVIHYAKTTAQVRMRKEPNTSCEVILSVPANTKTDLIEDYYVIDDYENDLVYENKIYVPKYMTRIIEKSTYAKYLYRNEYYSLQLTYHTYKNENALNMNFVDGESYEKKDFYYYLDKGNNVKIYFVNEFGYYQTLEISIYSRHIDDKTYLIDNSYENLLVNLTSLTTKKKLSDYAIKKEDGWYIDAIKYNFYVDEKQKNYIKADYKVSAEKYGSDYDPEFIFQELYLDNSSVSFYEGEITTDISSVKKQTRIRAFFSKINNLDVQAEAVSDLRFPLNQTAFENVTKDMVKIEVNSLQHNNSVVSYFKIVSDNNNCHNERIYAFYPIKENVYYIVQIYGGDYKELNINMINDFLPTNVEVQ